MKSPCKDCPDRVLGCHAECGRYLAYVEALEKIRRIRNGILRMNAPSPLLKRNIRNKLNRTKRSK